VSAVRVVDNGANAVLAAVGRNPKASVDVGILGDNASETKRGAKDITVGDVARWAEFGIGQPQRSWLRGWIDSHEALINERIDMETREVILGKQTSARALARIGVWLQGELQLNIANFPGNDLKPNKDSTIKRKGSSTPLIDTGQLRSSISHRVQG